jgi:hypothetical protein
MMRAAIGVSGRFQALDRFPILLLVSITDCLLGVLRKVEASGEHLSHLQCEVTHSFITARPSAERKQLGHAAAARRLPLRGQGTH